MTRHPPWGAAEEPWFLARNPSVVSALPGSVRDGSSWGTSGSQRGTQCVRGTCRSCPLEMADQRQVASMFERHVDPHVSRAADSNARAVLAGVQARRRRRPARGLRPGHRLRAAPFGNYRRPEKSTSVGCAARRPLCERPSHGTADSRAGRACAPDDRRSGCDAAHEPQGDLRDGRAAATSWNCACGSTRPNSRGRSGRLAPPEVHAVAGKVDQR